MRELSVSKYNVRYRGEGNANIVVSLDPGYEVLRISKWDPELTESFQVNEISNKLKTSQFYIEKFLLPVLGLPYVHVAEIVKISENDMKHLASNIQHLRPGWRLGKGLPECEWPALLLPDLCYLAPVSRHGAGQGVTLGLEIKPKCGFLPRSPFVPEKYGRKCIVCKFHLNQIGKLNQKKIQSVSRYCPLDLFSGCPRRMFRALDCLFEAPQNNLRLFQDGSELNLESTSDINSCLASFLDKNTDFSGLRKYFYHLVIEALTNAPVVEHGSGESCTSRCSLPEDSVLGGVLRGQKLDSLDVEGIIAHYDRLKLQFSNERLDQLLFKGEELNSSDCSEELKDSLQKVGDFLIAATCKDCSVLLVMRAASGTVETCGTTAQDPDKRIYLTGASIVDLDVKPHARIPKYLATERELLEMAQQVELPCSSAEK